MRQNYSMVKNSNVLLEPCEGKLSCTVLRNCLNLILKKCYRA